MEVLTNCLLYLPMKMTYQPLPSHAFMRHRCQGLKGVLCQGRLRLPQLFVRMLQYLPYLHNNISLLVRQLSEI